MPVAHRILIAADCGTSHSASSTNFGSHGSQERTADVTVHDENAHPWNSQRMARDTLCRDGTKKQTIGARVFLGKLHHQGLSTRSERKDV